MQIDFTTQQLHAISSRYGSLIVSAAAGSGKTAVLVERVIGLICDKERPRDIESLVVVTFTNAAAAEMRAKIATALLERLAESPEDVRIKRQLALLPGAKIQTVHAFCLELVRQNFAKCQIAADFKLGDEIECAILMQTALDELLEEKYTQNSDSFRELCLGLNEERGDRRLCETILEIYKKLRSHPNPEQWLDMVGKGLTMQNGEQPEHTSWGKFVLSCASDAMGYAIKNLRKAHSELNSDPDIFAAYHTAFELCMETADKWEKNVGNWDELYNMLVGFQNPSLSAVRKGNKELAQRLKLCKNQFTDTLAAVKAKYICAGSKQIKREMDFSAPLCAELCTLVADFSEIYAEKKRVRNILDFADLEHMALGLLTNENGCPSELGQAMAEHISEILVDEYQDTNEIQDAIFAAIKPKNGGLFMVGDVKQSIYRFRLANPDIFVDKYLAFDDFESGTSDNRRLALNRNFRSDQPVLELCNYIFSRTMSRRFGDIDYTENERLYNERSYTDLTFVESVPCEFYVLDMQDSRDDEDSPKAAQAEAILVSNRIAELMRDMKIIDKESKQLRSARPSDFVILLSSFRNKAPIYANELAKIGIPVAASGGGNMLESIEIQVLLSYLKIIDNRRQDVPLISVLRSPLYLFSPDELGEIRLCDTENSMLDALIAAGKSMPKANAFLDDLNVFIHAAQDCDTGQLLQLIFAKTGAMGVFAALDDGEERRQNLNTLLNMARAFEGNAAKGLYAFLQYVDRLAEDGRDISTPPQRSDAVQIMSIHKSKGLEYPVVFVPDLAKAFNTDDLKKPVLFHQHMGIGTKVRDSERRLEFKTQMYQAVLARSKRELFAEELRKLYVAMTRAKQKLILSVSLSNASKKLSQWAELAGEEVLPPELLAEQTSAAMWVCAALLSHPSSEELRAICETSVAVSADGERENLVAKVVHYTELTSAQEPQAERETRGFATEQYAPWLAKISLEYSHLVAAKLPSKLTPTGAKRLSSESAEVELKQKKPKVRLYGDPARAAKRGTATHRFLECASYTACIADGCAEELARLLAKQRLTAEQAKLIDLRRLEQFFKSPIAQRIVKADRHIREYEFSALFSPAEVLESDISDEDILMNGIIDLLIFEGESASIIDFKTDVIEAGSGDANAEKYRLQLDIYAKAAGKIFEKPIKDKIICFLHTGETILIE